MVKSIMEKILASASVIPQLHLGDVYAQNAYLSIFPNQKKQLPPSVQQQLPRKRMMRILK